MGNNHWYIQVGEKTFDYSLDILSTLPAIITNENCSLFNSFFKKLEYFGWLEWIFRCNSTSPGYQAAIFY